MRSSVVGYDTYLLGAHSTPKYYDPDSDFSLSSEWDTDDPESTTANKPSKWKKLKLYVRHVHPFIQTYKGNISQPWVQLAGHQGHFKTGRQPGTILKKLSVREKECFELLMRDNSLRPFVPEYHGQCKDENGNEFIELEDLLKHFANPCVMDCKIGVRTYLEEELIKARTKPKLRKDMYEKMYNVDRNAPTPEEHEQKGVTQPRYMVWRETISSTANLGFRIEAMKRPDGKSSKDYKTTKSEEQLSQALQSFHLGNPNIVKQFVQRLKALQEALQKSEFFKTHEVIGSSLLFIHDSKKASVWMIDFAKTCTLPEDVPSLCHDKMWKFGNHEDGYLIGLSNLIKLFSSVLH